jgi:acetyltransferase-like isoleucine patch superfamily enzyme
MYIGSAFPSNLKSSGSGLRDGNQTITIPTYNFATFKASATQLPTIQQNQNYLTQGNGLYYNDGNLTINQGNAQLIGNSTGSVIFVNGNITFNSNFNTSGTLFIITTGNIIVNSGTANFTNVVLLAEGNVTFANGMLLQPGVVVTPGTLSISGNSNFNTSASQFQSLVPNFNTIMTPYASSGSGGSGSSGGNAVVVSGWSSS